MSEPTRPTDDAARSRASDASSDDLDGSRRPRIWVLEDSPQQAAIVQDALSPLFDVTVFLESPLLIETLALSQPEVLVLDWYVPEISGLEVLRMVRETHDEATLPVIMLTAFHNDGADLREALDAGANDFAAKPFERGELRARVSTLLRVRRLHERARRAERELAAALAREEQARALAESQREAVTDERNLLTTVLEHTPVGIMAVDADSGRVLLSNRRAAAEVRQAIPKTDSMQDYPKWPLLDARAEPLPVEQFPAMRALRGEEAHAEELGYRFGDGTVGTLQVAFGPVRNREGTITGAVVVFQDVTARQLAMQQAQRNAEFEKQLIGIVSHDLRTPIGAISLGAALLEKDSTLSERQAKLVGRVVSSAGRASRMVTDLLDFTAVRLGGGLPVKLAPMDLHELTRKTVAEISLASLQTHAIELDQTGDANGEFDGDRVAQLIVNLVTNALHYSPRGSTVRVATHGDDGHVSLVVHNGGPPIPESLLPRLFLPMQRGLDELEPSRRSVGLGLFIVDEIVRAHGGSVEVHSTLVDGTTFSVRLPRMQR